MFALIYFFFSSSFSFFSSGFFLSVWCKIYINLICLFICFNFFFFFFSVKNIWFVYWWFSVFFWFAFGFTLFDDALVFVYSKGIMVLFRVFMSYRLQFLKWIPFLVACCFDYAHFIYVLMHRCFFYVCYSLIYIFIYFCLRKLTVNRFWKH